MSTTMLDEESAKKVFRQVEFYFSDSNLPKDEFLMKAINGSEDGMVSLALICSFSRMRSHLGLGTLKAHEIPDEIIKAVADTLKSSELVKISNDGKKVGRKTELTKVEELIEQLDNRTIVVSPLPYDVTLEGLVSFFAQYAKVNNVRLPGHVSNKRFFYGTALIELSSEEDVQHILKQRLAYDGVDLEIKPKKEFDAEREKQTVECGDLQASSPHKSVVGFTLKSMTSDGDSTMTAALERPEVASKDGKNGAAEGSKENANDNINPESDRKVDEDEKSFGDANEKDIKKELLEEKLNYHTYKGNVDVVLHENLKAGFQKLGTVKLLGSSQPLPTKYDQEDQELYARPASQLAMQPCKDVRMSSADEGAEAQEEDDQYAPQPLEHLGEEPQPSKQRRHRRRHGTATERKIEPRLTEAVPGGPTNPTLLKSFKGHVAYKIWLGEEREPLLCHTRNRMWNTWRMGDAPYKEGSWQQVALGSRLSHLGSIMFPHVNAPLVSAFVERWHPETNSFHMPWGEMTILLHDVHFILRIPIAGRIVKLDSGYDRELIANALASVLLMDHGSLSQEISRCKGLLKWTTIEQAKDHLPPNLAAVVYVLYLLGGTLFVDKSQDKIDPVFALLLIDFEETHTYAWGAAALAMLYRQLGMASRGDCKQIAGCLTLLEGWIYEYFPHFRPSISAMRNDYGPGLPRAARWSPPSSESNMQRLRQYRYMLDHILPFEVNWQPYGALNISRHSGLRMSIFHGFIQCMGIVEPYMPDRCTRQLGYIQRVPGDPFQPRVAKRPVMARSYTVEFDAVEGLWECNESHCLSARHLRHRTERGYECEPDYMEWYMPRTHPNIQNPENKQEDYVPGLRTDPCVRCVVAANLLRPYAATIDRMHPKVVVDALNILTATEPDPQLWQEGYFNAPPTEEHCGSSRGSSSSMRRPSFRRERSPWDDDIREDDREGGDDSDEDDFVDPRSD